VQTCDVAIVGGGPAGSSCAWKLTRAGFDVVVLDKATFPRDKICAGWITPPVIETLALDTTEYARSRTFQPITRFRTGIIDRPGSVDTTYDAPVSYGIRRSEFDDYLLRRSGARLLLGAPMKSLRRDGREWVLNETIAARAVVGAGGHFCPVARVVNGSPAPEVVVAAQEAEFRVLPEQANAFTTDPDRPELYFSADLKGYGWCFRKQDYVNIGIGRIGATSLPKVHAEFLEFLQARGIVPPATWKPRGHAYLLYQPGARTLVDDGLLLIGDAAGLACAQSGEGIRPAIESGLLAADTLIAAGDDPSRERLAPYVSRVHERCAVGASQPRPLPRMTERVSSALGRLLLYQPWFVRHVVLDRWFLHASQPPLIS
jgi:menaquinone-9 beta-reductase